MSIKMRLTGPSWGKRRGEVVEVEPTDRTGRYRALDGELGSVFGPNFDNRTSTFPNGFPDRWAGEIVTESGRAQFELVGELWGGSERRETVTAVYHEAEDGWMILAPAEIEGYYLYTPGTEQFKNWGGVFVSTTEPVTADPEPEPEPEHRPRRSHRRLLGTDVDKIAAVLKKLDKIKPFPDDTELDLSNVSMDFTIDVVMAGTFRYSYTWEAWYFEPATTTDEQDN